MLETHPEAPAAAAGPTESERRRVEAETLLEVATEITSELDLRKLVQKVTDLGTRLTGARFGAFFYNVLDERGERYQLFTLSGAPREAFEKFGMPRATPVFKPTFLGEGPVRSGDITRDERFGRMGPHHGMPKGHLAVRSYLAVPVVARGGEVLGGLFFGHPEPGVFDERAERSALAIAAQAAVAIDNAHLYGQAREEIARRSRMERDLRENERQYRELVEGLPVAVYTTDHEGRIELHNPAARRLWGEAPDASCPAWGARAALDASGAPLAPERCPVRRVLAGGPAVENAEVVLERADGSRRHVLASPRPMHDAEGRVVGVINTLVDITERKRAESELARTKDELAAQVETLTRLHELAMRLGGLRDGQQALQAILDTAVEAQDAAMGIMWVQEPGADDLVVQASRGFDDERAFLFQRVAPGPGGGTAGLAFDEGRRRVVEDVEADPGFPYREQARRAGFRAVHSTPIVTRTGALLGALSVHYATPRRPSQRDCQVADVCARHAADAIEAMRAQERLRESERLYRAIGESIDYGVWVCDAEGRNTYASESFLKLVGITQEECSDFGWKRVLHPDDADRTIEAWKRCVAQGSFWDVEHRMRGVDGRWHSVLARGVPVRNDRGQVVAWAGINLDIERMKRVEQELRELDERKNEFLATLAHELRNPLAPLRNGLELMRLANGEARTMDKARAMMERQLAQLVRLVDDLLDVSRVSRGKIELRREDAELAAVLRGAIETSQPLIDERRHELVVDLPPEPIVVNADVTRLAQVFWNLLNNAAKYTPAGGRICVSARWLGEGRAEVRVADNGLGIPPDMLARVFDTFTQVERAEEKAQGGLGIGLAIARRLVEMHGGSIEVESAGHGQGAEFIVRLPARVADARRDGGAGAGPPDARPAPKRRILVADDNVDSATTLSMMLEVMGNEVRVAHDGEEAVAAAADFRPDAMLLDIGMPKLDGYEACGRIRLLPWARETLIVALTGWGQEEDKTRARAAGFDRHLVKPVEPALLESLFRELPMKSSLSL